MFVLAAQNIYRRIQKRQHLVARSMLFAGMCAGTLNVIEPPLFVNHAQVDDAAVPAGEEYQRETPFVLQFVQDAADRGFRYAPVQGQASAGCRWRCGRRPQAPAPIPTPDRRCRWHVPINPARCSSPSTSPC